MIFIPWTRVNQLSLLKPRTENELLNIPIAWKSKNGNAVKKLRKRNSIYVAWRCCSLLSWREERFVKTKWMGVTWRPQKDIYIHYWDHLHVLTSLNTHVLPSQSIKHSYKYEVGGRPKISVEQWHFSKQTQSFICACDLNRGNHRLTINLSSH